MTNATPTFRPFTENDWNGFSGAEPFACGAEPLICEAEAYTIVTAKGGVELHLPDGSAYAQNSDELTPLAARALGQAVVTVLEGGGDASDLAALGLEEIINPQISEAELLQYSGVVRVLPINQQPTTADYQRLGVRPADAVF